MNKVFIYSDLFKVLPQSFKVSKLDFVSEGKTPAYSSDTTNNGRVGLVDKEPLFQITEDTPVYLVFGDHTRTMNIVHEDFCVMDNVKVLVPLVDMTDEVLLFITTCWKKAIPNLGYARHWSVAKDAKFELPVIESSDPHHAYTIDDIDYVFMQERITELEQERITELEQERIAELNAYLKASGLNDYKLTAADKEVLSLSPIDISDGAGALEADCRDDQIRFKKFKASDLFDIKKGKRLTKANMVKGNINFIGSTATNNGLTARIGNTEHLHPAHTITVSYNGSVGEVFLQDEPFWASDDVNVWYPKFEFNTEAVEYIMAVIKKCREKYNYATKWTIDKMRNELLVLPVTTDNEINFDYMKCYIRAIAKLAIADAIRYKNEVIEATKRVIVV